MELEDTGILSLSDYVLVDICEYLSPTDLWQLNRTCKRFYNVVRSKRLWRKIDARDEPQCQEKVNFCLDRVEDFTEDLRLCSTERSKEILPMDFPKCLPCTKLTVLALENQYIDGQTITLVDYPNTLVELSFRKTFIHYHNRFFKFSNAEMRNLKVLILDHCFWLETNLLVQFSKYTKLEILSLYNCRKLYDTDIAYISLAGCFGFKALRILDVRFSSLGDQIIKSFYKRHLLAEMYFQNYVTTYELEGAQRDLDIAHGAPKRKHSYRPTDDSSYDDVPILDVEAMRGRLGYEHCYGAVKLDNLTDDGPRNLSFLNPVASEYEVKSVLYERPYDRCTCSKGHPETAPLLKNKGPSSKLKSCRKAEIATLEERVEMERSRMFDVRMGHYITLSPPWLLVNPNQGPRNPYEVSIMEHSHAIAPRDCVSCNNTCIDARAEYQAVWAMGVRPPSPRDDENDAAPPAFSQAQMGRRYAELAAALNAGKRRRQAVEESSTSSDDEEGESPEKRGEDDGRGSTKRKRTSEGTVRNSKGAVFISIPGPSVAAYHEQERPERKLTIRRQDGGLILINVDIPEAGIPLRNFNIAALRPAKHPSNIRSLSFRGYKAVTNETLLSVMHLNLELLDVTYTSVDAEGLKSFASVNPSCRIVHESLCTCRPKYHY